MWHHDHPAPDGWPNPSYRNIKVFVAIFDIPQNGGPTALVPRTHRLPGNFVPGSQAGELLLRRGYRSHNQDYPPGADALPQEAMPNHVKMALPAGSAFLFDSSVWVSVLPL